MGYLTMVKGAVGLAATFGSGAIINNLIKATTPATTGQITKICIGVTGSILSMMGGKVVADEIGKQVEETETFVRGIMNKSKKQEAK